MNRASHSKSVIKHILIYAPGSIIPAALTLITSMIFTRIFSANEYGEYSLFLVVGMTLRLVTTMWLQQGIGRYLPPENSEIGKKKIKDVIVICIWTIFIFELFLGMILMFFIRPIFFSNYQSFFLPLVLFIIVTSIFDVFTVIFPAEMKAREFVTYRIIDGSMTFIFRLIPVLVFISRDIKIMFWSVIISNVLLIPIMWYRAGLPSIKSLTRNLTLKSNWTFVGILLSYGLPMTLWYFSSILLDVGDRYVLKFYLGNDAVGIYDANYRLISGTIGLIVAPITLTLHPFLMTISGAGNKKKIGEVLAFIIENLFILGLLAVGLVFIFHKDIALLLLGPEFREGSLIMPIILAGSIFFNIGTFAHKPFEIEKNIKIMLIFGIASAFINLILNFLFIPFLGYVGAAYATLVAYFIYTFSVGTLGRKLIPWNFDWKEMIPRIIFLITSIAFVFFMRSLIEKNLSYLYGFIFSFITCIFLALFSIIKIIKISNKIVKHVSI